MEAKSYFTGRALVKSLPVTDQAANRSEVCSRISSPRGDLAVLTDGAIPIRHLAYIELRPSMIRGNHFHKLRHEYCYLISGEVVLTLEDVTSGEKVTVPMQAGDMAQIPPGIAHAFNPTVPGHAVEFAAESFDIADVYPHRLV